MHLPLFTPPTAQRELVSVALVITEACNFRCVMCDYWKLENPKVMDVDVARRLAPLILAQHPHRMTVTGGEPLMHARWTEIVDLFCRDIPVRLCTNGLPLRSQADDVVTRIARLLVSIDAATEETFFRVRGVRGCPRRIWQALEIIKQKNPDIRIDVKMTIQKKNFHETCDFMEECLRRDYVDGVGFGMPDLSFMAFSLAVVDETAYRSGVLLDASEVERFSEVVDRFYSQYHSSVESGYLFEGDLTRYLQRFKSLAGLGPPPPSRRCTIPRYSIVVDPDGQIRGCFFLPGDTSVTRLLGEGVPALMEKREAFDSTQNRICRGCDQLLFARSPFEQADPSG
jgi:MoaA/NifB/PqqE/SkfB family radical SAM enzyme